MKKSLLIAAAIFVLSTYGELYAQVSKESEKTKKDSVVGIKKEVSNRNVMLNAENNTGPRSVNIGLPFRGDVVILENDVPVVNSFYPTIPTTEWRYDSSLAEMGLLSFSETALAFGKVGMAVKSSDRDASSSFKGYASIYLNSYGSSIYDAAVTGPLGKKGWGYMASIYECFDRGSGTDWKYTPWTDRTEMLKFGITKKYGKGSVRVLYKLANSRMQFMRYNPLTYEGNGNTSPLDNFKLGQDSYVLRDGMIPYFDALTGDKAYANLTDDKWSKNLGHNVYLSGDHNFGGDWKLNYSSLFQKIKAPFPIAFPLSLLVKDPDQRAAGEIYKYKGTTELYNGSVQSVISQMSPQSDITFSATMAELKKKFKDHNVRFGFNYQYYSLKSQTNTGLFLQTVEASPRQLDQYRVIPGLGEIKITDAFGLYPVQAGGYGSTSEYTTRKTALYASDDFNIGKRLTLQAGLRAEYQNIHDLKNPYINDFAKGRPFIEHDFKNDWNKVGTTSLIYKLTGVAGFIADYTYNSWNDRYWDYAYRDANGNPIAEPGTPAGTKPQQTVPNTFENKVVNYGGGMYFNFSDKLNIVSKITRITKENILTSQQITNPANTAQRSTFDPIFYDISTIGWTTDIVAKPFKNFNVHALFTLQNPQYKNYEYSAFGVTYDYNDSSIPELSKTLIELDPSYSLMDGALRLWVSLRYFGKQYGNPTNAFEYNGWWENFGGVDYRVSRKFNLKLQVVNFLDQEGVKGVMQGADQITDATPYVGRKIVANGIRPRTVELTATIKF